MWIDPETVSDSLDALLPHGNEADSGRVDVSVRDFGSCAAERVGAGGGAGGRLPVRVGQTVVRLVMYALAAKIDRPPGAVGARRGRSCA
ncbi:hypothetical protein Airi02_105590 [Actinoallomurus iriomotensis]|uniref:Uncharacterized protein n=1 Tax=Actinoallomurus iriomotensis TaxID=478107 RepID=A0A9W6W7X9_9ACTN|nr:hypothetical protein Airi02_105590 [Actinoallomurus iriomotensis]